MAGVVSTIANPSGVISINIADVENVVGAIHAKYLDAHGYGMEVVKAVVDAYRSAKTMEDFVSEVYRCRMTVVELEWFWELSWCL